MRIPRDLRFLIVVVAGYGLDFAASFAAFKLLGLPLVAAAALGFSLAVIATYLAHAVWTFADRREGGDGTRFVKYIGAALVGLAVRSLFIWSLARFATSDLEHAAVLVGAAGFSLCVNYVLTRFAVFGAKPVSGGGRSDR
ncbi:GtrA family protein [Aquabacter spiritensis]|uniref:Putative flippase GtrA n=1 Tax=Aquabacter spiritensis TaxID=933073 RepID=A0A4R3LZN4_9HYPH|nr:GtrA family protein [Aquabacter spiritensis]TCT06180.1 putative flippase GtrA [Aquabacter spiritensis]